MTCSVSLNESTKCHGKNLSAIMKCYQDKIAACFLRELNYFAEGSGPKDILDKSCASILENKKMHSHQCRVGVNILAMIRTRLVGFRFSRFENFDDLHEAVWEKTHNIPRVGPLTIYDISLRLAHSIDKHPECVYLHAGALVGAKKLKIIYPRVTWDKGLLDVECLPKAFGGLKPMEIENLLCTCKAALGALKSL